VLDRGGPSAEEAHLVGELVAQLHQGRDGPTTIVLVLAEAAGGHVAVDTAADALRLVVIGHRGREVVELFFDLGLLAVERAEAHGVAALGIEVAVQVGCDERAGGAWPPSVDPPGGSSAAKEEEGA
jgi:hypothetical protein